MAINENTRKRPVNLDVTTMKLPVMGVASILHRLSGVFIFVMLGVLLCALDMSLANENSFMALKASLDNIWWKLTLWAVLSGLIYHFVAGIRHLLMDAGIGESLEGGRRSAWITIVLSAVLIVLAGVWIWLG